MFLRSLTYIFCTFILVTLSLTAAAPITHAYLTERFLAHFPYADEAAERAFMIGTQLPDIRYLGGVERAHTHADEMSLEEILNEPSPFLAGLKFHSYVDLQREAFVVEHDVYSYLAAYAALQPATMLKLLEDQVLYSLFDSNKWQRALDPLMPEEQTFGIPTSQVECWHHIVKCTFLFKPTFLLKAAVLCQRGLFGLTSSETAIMQAQLVQLSADPYFTTHTQALIEHFERLLNNANCRPQRVLLPLP